MALASHSTLPYSGIAGTGSALPSNRVSNQQLVEQLACKGIETSDAWILERTGIRYRHLVDAATNNATTQLATQAALKAIDAAGCLPDEIDLIVVATSTPDHIFPSTACLVQHKLGAAQAAAFDIQAVCSGFVYALTIADQFIRTGQARCAVVIGADVFSRIIDWQDRSTCVLFGDGAGAVVLKAQAQPGILASRLHAAGALSSILCTPASLQQGHVIGHPFLTMDGQAVFKQAVTALEAVAREVCAAADLPLAQLDWLIPHQANIRILQATSKRLEVPFDRVIVTVDQHANTSAASVPLALDMAVRDGRIQAGQKILLQGVGGGFTWGATLVQMG